MLGWNSFASLPPRKGLLWDHSYTCICSWRRAITKKRQENGPLLEATFRTQKEVTKSECPLLSVTCCGPFFGAGSGLKCWAVFRPPLLDPIRPLTVTCCGRFFGAGSGRKFWAVFRPPLDEDVSLQGYLYSEYYFAAGRRT